MRYVVKIFCVIALGYTICLAASTASAAGGACPASVPADITSCYYIDYVGGSDSNNGTSKATAWKHGPGMYPVVLNVGPGTIDDYAGNKCYYACDLSHVGFIFKGGVTWDKLAFPWVMRQKGTAANARVYWGVDPTWYTGAAWSRPILNYGGSSPRTVCGEMITWGGDVTYAMWDNFEFTGFYWNSTCDGTPDGQLSMLTLGTGGHYEIKNNYFHGWSHDGVGADSARAINGDMQGLDGTSIVHDNIFDGYDVNNTSGTSLNAIKGSPLIIYNNYFGYLSNALVLSTQNNQTYIYNNTFEAIRDSYHAASHENIYEDVAPSRGTFFYNNLIKDCAAGEPGWGVAVAAQVGYTAYVWNNVMSNSGGNPVFGAASGNAGAIGPTYFLNNTVESGTDADPSKQLLNGGADGPTYYYGNHIIGSRDNAADCASGGSNCTQSNNLFQTKAAAAAQGYAYSSTYPFSANGSTVGAGTDRTSTTPGCGTTGLSSLCSGTTAGVVYNRTTKTITGNTITPNARGGTWDIGAYEWPVSGGGSPTGTITLSVRSIVWWLILPVGLFGAAIRVLPSVMGWVCRRLYAWLADGVGGVGGVGSPTNVAPVRPRPAGGDAPDWGEQPRRADVDTEIPMANEPAELAATPLNADMR